MTSIGMLYAAGALAIPLAACGQSNPVYAPPPGGAATMQRPETPPNRAGPTLYVANIAGSSLSQLIGYSLRSLKLTYSTDDQSLKEPEGITADASGAVYVANTYGYDILKFVPPASSPVERIEEKTYRPTDVAVDSKGDIWVANWCTKSSCGRGDVREYSSSGKLLKTITCSNLLWYVFLAVDRNDDVVVDGAAYYSQTARAGEIAAGSSTCTPLTAVQPATSGGVQFTKDGDLTVIDTTYEIMYTYAKPHFSKVIATTSMVNYIPSPVEDVFVKGDKYFWTSVQGYNGVYEFAYPGGGYPVRHINGIYFPTGVAIVTK